MNDTKNINYGVSNSLLDRIKNALDLNLKTQIIKIIPSMHPADQAELISNFKKDERKKIINILKDQFDGEVLLELNDDIRNEILDFFTRNDIIEILSKLDTDDVVYILADIDDKNLVHDIIEASKLNSTRALIEESLSYPEDSIGRIMDSSRYTAVPKDWTVLDLTKYMQKNRSLTGEFSEIVIVDEYFRPVSTISAGQVLISEYNKKMSEIMRDTENLKILQCDMQESEAAILFTKYDLNSAPVVNDNGVLVGMVYLTDMVEVVEKEAAEDLLLMGNISEDDIHSGVIETAKKRLPWLFITILTTAISTCVIASFSGVIKKNVILPALLPLLAGLGGVCSTQTLTVMIRNIAGHKINKSNIKSILLKESLTGLSNGIIISCISCLAIYLWQRNLTLSLIFAITILFILFFASLIGSVVPFIISKIGLDPAAASSSFTTTSIDVLSSLILFKLASMLL